MRISRIDLIYNKVCLGNLEHCSPVTQACLSVKAVKASETSNVNLSKHQRFLEDLSD
jgi:hypothetical protein